MINVSEEGVETLPEQVKYKLEPPKNKRARGIDGTVVDVRIGEVKGSRLSIVYIYSREANMASHSEGELSNKWPFDKHSPEEVNKHLVPQLPSSFIESQLYQGNVHRHTFAYDSETHEGIERSVDELHKELYGKS
jgi:hypothetical protein